MELADRVMHAATPELRPPPAVRDGDAPPRVVGVAGMATRGRGRRGDGEAGRRELPTGNVAVVGADAMVDTISAAARRRRHRPRPGDTGPASTIGSPSCRSASSRASSSTASSSSSRRQIVADEIQGLRALYVALTRPTQRLTVVHAEPLPVALAGS